MPIFVPPPGTPPQSGPFGQATQRWQGQQSGQPAARPVSTVTRGRASGGSGAGGGGGSNPIIDAMLGLLGGGGGGSYYGGYNGEPARAAARSAYDTQLGNTKNVYGQIDTQIKDRAPLIRQGYQQASATINNDAQQRAAADAARGAEADLRNMQTAAALGLNVAAPSNTEADALQQAGQQAYQQNAQAWTGFNTAAAQTAGERNTATGDAFKYAGTQAEQSLAAMLQQALANIAAQEAANPGGYSGGGSSASNDLKILTTLLGYDTDQQKIAAASAGKSNPLANISPAGWQGIQQAYGGVGSLGLGNAQAQSLALKQLANNPRDFATLYSTLYGG